MVSFRAKILIALVRNRHWFKFKLRPEVVDEGFSVEAFRAEVDRATAKMKLPKGVTTRKEQIGSLAAEWLLPEAPRAKKVLLYVHGGGFISGSCHTHRPHVAKFAMQAQVASLLFDYRLEPEHPFPAAVEDCVAAFRWLLAQGHDPQDIVVGGESAGATLTLSLLLALQQEGVALPKAAFAISPVTDLRCEAESFRSNAPRDIAPLGSWGTWTGYYMGDNDPMQPLLSPLFGDYTGLPPLHITVGTHEIHLDDCDAVAARASACGVEVVLRRWEGMVHAFPLFTPLFPEAKAAFAEIIAFIDAHLAA